MIDLGDENSKTLGFLPYAAFEKFALLNQIYGVIQNEELLGYLLYRVSYRRVSIVHLCVSKKHRGKNVAKLLVDKLKKDTKNFLEIRLSCRNDYGIDSVWESFNFVPIQEKIGRSKKKLPLTIWRFKHNHANLFSKLFDSEFQNKISAAIDMNVFLDIKDKRNKESQALKSDWVLSETTFYLTPEIFVEIKRNTDSGLRKESRETAFGFKFLELKDETKFNEIYNQLEKEFKPKDKNDISDLRHIAYSIVSGVNFFISRDERLLKRKSILEDFKLQVFRPSEFIVHLDEILQSPKYEPQRLIGTNINSIRVSSDKLNILCDKFLAPRERKNNLKSLLRYYSAFPKNHDLITVTKDDEYLSMMIIDKSTENIIKVPVFRFLKNELKITLAKHLLYKLILIGVSKKWTVIEIEETQFDYDLIRVLKESRFMLINNRWVKYNIRGIYNELNLIQNIEKVIGRDSDRLKIIIEKLTSFKKNKDFVNNYNIERFFSPIKIVDLEIPTYIVPIKPHWAEKLFNDKSDQKLPLFEPRYKLLLNRKNVYYRSSKSKILSCPSRVLWYLSENKSEGTKGMIRAISYIDEILIDTPKKLYNQFKQLGIYEWKDISKIESNRNKNEIMAFVFSDTELFKKSISHSYIYSKFKHWESKNFMPIAPIKISNETFNEIYKIGMNYE